MFTGLVSHCVQLRSISRQGTGIRISCPNPWHDSADDPVTPGESIAVSGCCLTVLEPIGEDLHFDLSQETLARTWFGEAAIGRALNLERSLRLSDRLGGHLVSAHIDGRGELLAIQDSGDGGQRWSFRAAPEVERYLIEKGSVCIDGVSLTVVEPTGSKFSVALIPSTLAATSLGTAVVGQRVHLEADQVGKWIEKLIRTR